MRSLIVLAACLHFVTPAALAHEGEDHAPSAVATSLPASAAPRAEAVSEAFESVMVLEDGKLTLYLDDFASNEPVAGARVEIEGSCLHGTAMEVTPGVYVMAAPALSPARHELMLSIETRDGADLLPLTLEVAQPPAAVSSTPAQDGKLAWLGIGALALAGGAGLTARRRARESA